MCSVCRLCRTKDKKEKEGKIIQTVCIWIDIRRPHELVTFLCLGHIIIVPPVFVSGKTRIFHSKIASRSPDLRSFSVPDGSVRLLVLGVTVLMKNQSRGLRVKLWDVISIVARCYSSRDLTEACSEQSCPLDARETAGMTSIVLMMKYVRVQLRTKVASGTRLVVRSFLLSSSSLVCYRSRVLPPTVCC